MDKLLVSFLLDRYQVETCFRAQDLERLAAACQVRCARPEKLTEALKLDLARGADVWVTGWNTGAITQAMLEAAPKLKLVAHAAGSTRTMLPEGFWQRGVRLMTTNDALGRGVAETTLGLLICSSKRIWPLSAAARQGGWRVREEMERIKELFDVTVGVVSAGRVGRHLLRLLRGFEVEVLLYDPYVSAAEAHALGARPVELLELCRRSDFVACCAPSTPETQRLLRAEHFQAMKDDCIVVNPSRGAVLDEAALIAELQKGRLFACLDVTDPEPPAADSPLRRLPNVILTPHIAGHVANARWRQGRDAVDDILRFLAGQPLAFEVTEARHRIMA